MAFTTRNSSAPDTAPISTTKAMLSCFFYCFSGGLCYSQMAARIPALQALAQTDAAGLGTALLCLGVGSIVGFVSIGILSRRLATSIFLRSSCLVFALAMLTLSQASNLILLCANMALIGFSFAWLEVSVKSPCAYAHGFLPF